MWNRLLLTLLALCLTLTAGCRTFNKEITKTMYQKKPKTLESHSSGSKKYTLTNSQVREIDFAGSVRVEDVNVSYQRGLDAQADCIASRTSKLLSEVEERTGVQLSFEAKIYLLRVDEIPQSFNISVVSDANEFCLPLFVEAGNESCETIISTNWGYPTLLTHELTECSLIFPIQGGRVLTDLRWKWFIFSGVYRNYTRWFREGLGNYAGYLAYDMVSEDLKFAASQIPPACVPFIFERPFSCLSRIGKDLFSWHQYSSTKLDHDYYNAALGLFLLIADQFGEEAIREIMREIKNRSYLDGIDLIKLTNRTLGTDIRELVERFEFPRTGFKIKPLTPATTLNEGLDVTKGLFVTHVEPNSPADDAGIKKKDVILKINDRSISSHLDFEMAIFERMQQQNIEALIWRKEQGQIMTELQLTNDN